MNERSLVVFGGTGWMGQAMLLPALQSGFLTPGQLTVVNRNGKALPGYAEVSVLTQPQEIPAETDVVVFSVRPSDFPVCQVDCSACLVISIMAGVSTAEIAAHTGATRIVRAMPNAAAECAQSYTPYIATESVGSEELAFANDFFKSFGRCDCLPTEDAFNYYVALTGAGHGTLAFFASSMIDAAVKQGLDAACAERGVRQLFKGVGQLLAEEENSPQETVTRVVEYAGTTAELVTTLEKSGVSEQVKTALLAAYAKASSTMSTQ